ncbi:MAG: pectate lyase [Prevotella sp.]|nr:pectate lyase [Prevotella sp.]
MKRQLITNITLMLLVLLAGITTISAEEAKEKTPAFPGAEGFGRYVSGGRGGKVYHVTNLNDSGTGSLRWAVGQNGTRTIVFDVSGTIHLKSVLNIKGGNLTIAGQTAPGDGICIADYPVSIQANNVILRYLRFRLGNKYVTENGADSWDGLGGMDQQDIMVDHCSVSWSIDECLSIYGVKNSTVQWCISSQSLQDAGHSKGAHGYGGNWGGSGVTYHHNLMAHHESRVPRLGPRYTTQLDERLDMRNNVLYNWAGNGCYGGEAMKVNIVNNYYKPGPGTAQISAVRQRRIAGIGIRTSQYVKTYPAYQPTEHIWGKFYVDGNVNSKYSDVTNDNWTYGIYNQITNSDNDNLFTATTKDTIKLSQPIDFVYVTTHTATDAYKKVLAYAGCCLTRDDVDQLIINDTQNGLATHTGSGNHNGMIDSQEDNKPVDADANWSAWPTLNSTEAPVDTDGDGMPDSWETANGLDPNNAKDGSIVGEDGYTNLENYLNSIVAEITEGQLEGGTALGNIVKEDPLVSTEYEISNQTHTADISTTEWGFSDGITVSNNKSKTYSNSSNLVKFSAASYTIKLPKNVSINRIVFEGRDNYEDADAYISEVNGETFGATDYVFPKDKSMQTYSIALSTPATGTLTFTTKVKQICAIIRLYSSTSTGISTVRGNKQMQERVFTIDGREVRGKEGKGIYIICPEGNGKIEKHIRK